MYSQIAVCLVLCAGAYAHGHMSGMGNWGMNSNGMNWRNNMMGQQMGQMNLLQQLLGMQNGMNGMGNGMGMNGMGMNGMGMNGMAGGRGGMMNTIMGMLLQSMMQNNMAGHRGRDDDDDDDHDDMSREDMKKLEGYMKMEFAMEVAHIAVVYKEYKDAMEAFKEMVDNLCLGVEAAYEHGRRFNETENATLSDAADRAGERIDSIDSREGKIDALVDLIENNEDVFGLGFFKVATLVCTTGETYMKAYEKMEALEKGGDCQACDRH